MVLFALVETEALREAVRGAVADPGEVQFFEDVSSAATAHRSRAASAIVVEWSAHPNLDFAALGAGEAPPVIALVTDSEAFSGALEAGASDCEIDPSAARIASRIQVALHRAERHRQLRADAGLLRMMTSAAESDARLWEYDLAARRFTRIHPPGSSTRRHSAERIASLSWTDLYPATSRARVQDEVRSCLDQFRTTGSLAGRTFDVEMNNADGSTGSRRLTLSVGLDARGEPTLVRGITWDTTELARAKTSLETLGAGVTSLLESLPVPILTLRGDGTVVTWNPAARRVFGYADDEIVGRPFTLADVQGASFFSERVLPACAGGVTLDGCESVCLRKDGEPIHVSIWTGKIGAGFGAPDDMVFMIVADVDQQKRAELESRQLFEAAHDAILVFDPAREEILDVNARGCEIYGRPREEMIGASLEAFSSDPGRGRQKVRETLESGALLRFETVQYRKTGEPVIFDVNASRIMYRGRPAILSVNRDITARRAQAEELRKRDRALAEASKLEAVGRLAGGIAHDFNNLLMVIGACSEVLTQDLDESSPYAPEVADLEGAIVRAKLVRQLLTFARQDPTEVRTIHLFEVLDPLRGILRRLVGEDIELVSELDRRAAVCVRMDPTQLEQVIVNLVANARDAIAGVGVIHLAARRSTTAGFVEIDVRDNGAGMDEATRARVFEPFFTTKEVGRGTGLGLATAHGIVVASGGEITVKSSPGRGTTFRVSLPIFDEAPESVSSRREQRASRPGSESILLVEDEPAVRRILARELKRSGYEVLESENGAEALDVVAAYGDSIDLLVTDVVMPKMSGDELARRLLSARPHLKVIFMSGHMERNVVREIAEGGLGAILAKPFAPAQLMEKVRAVLEAEA